MTIVPKADLHWVYAGFFAFAAVYVALNGRYALNARCAWAGLRVAAGDGSSDDQRIEAAVQRRQAAEGAPAPIGLYLSVVLLLLAAASALNVATLPLLYSILCVVAPLITAVTFSQLRNLQPIRAAVLTVRTSGSVIPVYWFVAAALSALFALSFVNVPSYTIPAVIVCISSLATIYMAWRMTLLPAMLSGEDIPAEQLVDDRLRFNRSTMCMFYALAQTFVFCLQFRDLDALQTAALLLSFSAIGFYVWITLWRYRAVRLA